MEKFQSKFSIEDTAVPSLCLQGMPIVGDALESAFFEKHVVPASVSVERLLATAEERRVDTLRSRMAISSGEETARAIYQKTLKEVSQGTKTGPLTPDEVTDSGSSGIWYPHSVSTRVKMNQATRSSDG